MNVKIIKLSSGEEVVAEVRWVKGEHDAESKCVMKNPVRLMPVKGPDGQPTLGMTPFSPFSKDKEFAIPNRFVMCEMAIEDELAEGYNEQFGTILTSSHG